jgi:hypothetical protein
VAFVEITPRDLLARLERGEELQLIDVRRSIRACGRTERRRSPN